ncbi:probable alpha-aspartyl dipeptidase [Eurosta solidaginis]|uniref:probable alpha-aspartyl dipeptidase n=1 Tax=Eurosta solidaginis TaxID=178769 RepID=UPI003530DFE3
MSKRSIFLLSSSRFHGFDFLEHAKEYLKDFLSRHNIKTVLFIPYAQKDHNEYTELISKTLSPWGYKVEGIHAKPNAIQAVLEAEAIFIGGGNTFALLKLLYDENLIPVIRERVLRKGVPYIGSSAGTNVATLSIHTTNDMPITYPPSFEALRLVPFNINPHYLDPNALTQHKGETRDQRINEFIDYHKLPVLGLREGTALLVEGSKATLVGDRNAKLFTSDKQQVEFTPNSDLSFLLNKD